MKTHTHPSEFRRHKRTAASLSYTVIRDLDRGRMVFIPAGDVQASAPRIAS